MTWPPVTRVTPTNARLFRIVCIKDIIDTTKYSNIFAYAIVSADISQPVCFTWKYIICCTRTIDNTTNIQMSIPFSIVVIKACVNSMFWYISITVCFASWCCIDMSIRIAKTCGQVISQLFTHIRIDATSFFSVKIAILTCEVCRISHNPTDLILCTTAKEAEITIPSFTEFMVYT